MSQRAFTEPVTGPSAPLYLALLQIFHRRSTNVLVLGPRCLVHVLRPTSVHKQSGGQGIERGPGVGPLKYRGEVGLVSHAKLELRDLSLSDTDITSFPPLDCHLLTVDLLSDTDITVLSRLNP